MDKIQIYTPEIMCKHKEKLFLLYDGQTLSPVSQKGVDTPSLETSIAQLGHSPK